MCLLYIDKQSQNKYETALSQYATAHRKLFSTLITCVQKQEYSIKALDTHGIHVYNKIRDWILQTLCIKDTNHANDFLFTLYMQLYIKNEEILNNFIKLQKDKHKHYSEPQKYTKLDILQAWKQLCTMFNVRYIEVPSMHCVYTLLQKANIVADSNDIGISYIVQQSNITLNLRYSDKDIETMTNLLYKLNNNFSSIKMLTNIVRFAEPSETETKKENKQEWQQDERILLEYIRYIPITNNTILYTAIHEYIHKHDELLVLHALPVHMQIAVMLEDSTVNLLSQKQLFYIVDITQHEIHILSRAMSRFHTRLLYHKQDPL